MYEIGSDGGAAASSLPTRSRAAAPGTGSISRTHLKVMIVGDSMTHGTEGDHTWRYRIWEWFRDAVPTLEVDFVGPKVGTVPPTDPEPPQPPRLPGEPEQPDRDVFTGGYAKDCSPRWKPNHFSQTGRAMWQAKDWIEETVAEFQPDLLLVMLGFNDMAWCVTGPEDLFENTKTFIESARRSKPDINFAIGNVPQRPFMESHKDLFVWTSKFGSLLHWNAPSLSRPSSRVEIVEIERSYGYVPDRCKGTYDSIHPNELGEYQIASAFSHTLHEKFGFGDAPLTVPQEVPARVIAKPKNPKTFGVPYGIRFTFDPVYGTVGYDIRKRSKGAGDWSNWEEGVAMTNQVDDSWAQEGVKYEFQARGRHGDEDKGEWSDVTHGVAEKRTAPPPRNGKVYATSSGFEATWDEIDTEKWDVDRYAILYADKAGGFLCAKGARGTSGFVDDLERGHKFDVMLQTWTKKEGPGAMAGIGTVVVGSGVFSRPENDHSRTWGGPL